MEPQPTATTSALMSEGWNELERGKVREVLAGHAKEGGAGIPMLEG